jgi:PKD repeat protein
VNKPPTLADIPNQIICYTTDQQTLILRNISAGPEHWQSNTVSVSSDNPDLFAGLEAHGLSNGNGFVRYGLSRNASGKAVVTITVTDDGGTANGGVDKISKRFTVIVYAPPAIRLQASTIENSFASGKKTGIKSVTQIQLNASATERVRYAWFPAGQLDNPVIANPVFTPPAPGKYVVNIMATNAHGCTSLDSLSVVTCEGTGKITLSVFPNPASKNANVHFSLPSDDAHVSLDIYSADGAKVKNLYAGEVTGNRPYTVTFNGSVFASGVYVIRLSSLLYAKDLRLILAK